MREAIERDGRIIGWMMRGPDGSWWITLAGRLPTTLGPDRNREALVDRAHDKWRSTTSTPRSSRKGHCDACDHHQLHTLGGRDDLTSRRADLRRHHGGFRAQELDKVDLKPVLTWEDLQ
ncbi:MAG: hypothetical protein HC923_12815, partial [Myxococcales bacterium]|nr:hypothetical protein [Myxococcales bacterium]